MSIKSETTVLLKYPIGGAFLSSKDLFLISSWTVGIGDKRSSLLRLSRAAIAAHICKYLNTCWADHAQVGVRVLFILHGKGKNLGPVEKG